MSLHQIMRRVHANKLFNSSQSASGTQNKSLLRRISIILSAYLAIACTHGLDITGEGDIFSSTGTRDCAQESAPCSFVVSEDYFETYVAIPGFRRTFVGWDVCGNETTSFCSFRVPVNVVQQFNGQTMPSTVANFGEPDPSRIEGLYDGNYIAAGVDADLSCLVRTTGRMLCRAVDDNRDLLSVLDLQLDFQPDVIGPGGRQIVGGSGTEYWAPDDFDAFEVTNINGSYEGHDELIITFDSGGVGVEARADFYRAQFDIVAPLRVFAGEYDLFSVEGGGFARPTMNSSGTYTAVFDNCQITIQMSPPLENLNTYDVTLNTDCPGYDSSYTGLSMVKYFQSSQFLEHEMVFISDGGDQQPVIFFESAKDL